MRDEVRRQPLGCAAAKSVRMPRSAWLRREASKFFLAHGLQPGGPENKLCPCEEPKEALADTGPDGRMVPTFVWRTQTLSRRAAMRLHSNRSPRPSCL